MIYGVIWCVYWARGWQTNLNNQFPWRFQSRGAMSTQKAIQDLRTHLQFAVIDGTSKYVELNLSQNYRYLLVYSLVDDAGYLKQELLRGLDENTSG